MKKLLFGLVLSFVSSTSVLAVDGIRVDGYLGNETRQAIRDNPELASQYNLNVAGCDSNNVNCGGTNEQVRAFQAALAGQGGGQSTGTGLYQVKLQEPLQAGKSTLAAANGVDLINQYIGLIYMWAASIVGLIAVLMIVASGIQIIFGGASPELVSDAKTRVVQALLSLVLLFGTALLLKTINPGFFSYM